MTPRPTHRALALAVVPLLGAAGCSSSSAGEAQNATTAPEAGSTATDYVATTADFDCLKNSEWTTVGVSRFKNQLGHTAEMLEVAKSPDGGTYPVGTIVQLVPTEASVKRGAGFSAESHDWEFFTLGVAAPSGDSGTSTGTTIETRGGDAGIVNFTGSSCLGCHSGAAPQWDLVCGDVDGGNTHGCAALPVSGAGLAMLQGTDARCK